MARRQPASGGHMSGQSAGLSCRHPQPAQHVLPHPCALFCLCPGLTVGPWHALALPGPQCSHPSKGPISPDCREQGAGSQGPGEVR